MALAKSMNGAFKINAPYPFTNWFGKRVHSDILLSILIFVRKGTGIFKIHSTEFMPEQLLQNLYSIEKELMSEIRNVITDCEFFCSYVSLI